MPRKTGFHKVHSSSLQDRGSQGLSVPWPPPTALENSTSKLARKKVLGSNQSHNYSTQTAQDLCPVLKRNRPHSQRY